jgi:hypothetical protein
MKYKTISLSYGNGENNLIHQMSNYGYGLIHKQDPDYKTGNIEAYYTFCGSNKSPDIEDVNFRGDVTLKPTKRLRFLKRIQKLFSPTQLIQR